ncbi:hypothetical protein JMJ56_18555 [Belnapia sp. T18]|uniref:Type III secretion chaperone SycN n=1 Tax=Belnapia arida TaxID=2804533 RepID=A0ABS1U5R1_9PROT|nr:hypothetical protein [Belnapia arida]MBL6080026.1 hypothetical protein [Belnapia arida]
MSAQAGIRAFCEGLGVAMPRTMPVVLRFERAGRLLIAEDRGGLTLLLERDLPAWRTGVLAAALRAVHPARGVPRPVHIRCRSHRSLLLSLHLAAEEVDTPMLDGCLRLLNRLADEAEAGAQP